VAVTNNLQRIGVRPLLMGQGGEAPLSRCAYRILPGVERLQVTYQLHDRLPSALARTSDWGTVVLHAEQPGSGAGRCYLTVSIAHSFLSRTGWGEVGAGQPITFTADVVGFAVSIDAGVTGS
jgi:hypothetical protein